MKQAIKKSQLKAGRWIRVRYDDVGCRDAILIEVDQRSDWPTQYKIFEPGTPNGNEHVDFDQIVAVGPFANVPAF